LNRQTQLFMTSADELEFSRELRNSVPQIRFIDDNVWDSPEPRLRESIAACKTHFAFIWNPSVIQQLPIVRRAGSGYEGPNSGPVIGVDDADEPMLEFAKLAWHVLGKVASPSLVTLGGGEPAGEY
jgi:hypothetical protein